MAIPIQITFNEIVNVTGTPQLTLETGTSDAVVAYSAGSGSTVLTFNYTVAAGHTSTDLDYVDIGSLALNGGTVKDAADNPAILTLPAPGAPGSLGANKAIVIDTTAPALPIVSGDTPTEDTTPTWSWVSGGGGNGTYRHKLDDSDLTSGATTVTALSFTPEAALTEGLHTLYVQERDEAGNWSSSGSFGITVNINEAPVFTEGAGPVPVTSDEDDAPTPFALTLNATDPDPADTLTWSIQTQPAHGTATAGGTGASKVIGYTPTADWNGSDSFVVEVADGNGGTDTISVTVTVSPRNDAPSNTVLPSIAGIPHFGSMVTAVNGTWNDSTDVTPGAITYTYQWQRADDGAGTGAADIPAATAFTYTPIALDNQKHVRVRVTATDNGEGLPSTASTTAESAWIQVANAAAVITEGDSTAVTSDEDNAPTAFALTLNATDEDTGDTLTWSIETAAAHGTATASGTGTSKVIGYTPAADWNGSDSFVVKVADGNGGEDTITVNVTVSPRNDAPVNTVPLGQTVYEETNMAFSVGNNNAITVTDLDVAETTGGRLMITLAVSHGRLYLARTTGLTITVGDGSADPTMAFNGLPGDLNAAMNGLVYQGDANYSGEDTLSITTSDMGNTGAVGVMVDADSVSITVNNINDLPVLGGAGNTLAYTENQAASPVCTTLMLTDPDDETMESAEVLIGENYFNGQDVLAFADTAKIMGSWAVNSGSLTLTRVAGQTPTLDDWRDALRSITYFNSSENPSTASRMVGFRVHDGTGYSGFVMSTITVALANDAPVITEGAATSVTSDEDNDPAAFALTLHAADIDPGDTLSWSILTPASYGTAVAGGTGTLKVIGYTPATDWNGSDSFVIEVADGNGGTDTITVNVTVSPRNDPPNNTVPPSVVGTPHVGQMLTAVNGTWNDSTDVTPGTMTYAYQWQRADDAAGTGAADIPAATVSTYTPTGLDNQKYLRVRTTATDNGEGLPATASATAASAWTQVANAAPVVTEGDSTAVTSDEDNAPTAFALTLNATDEDTGDTLTWSIETAAAHGTATASGTGASKVVGYTPAADWNGSDSFVVKVADGNGGEDTITVNVTVSPRNDAPMNTVPLGQTVNEETNMAFSVGNNNAITVTDLDVAETTGGRLMITLAVSHGRLYLARTTGLIFTVGDGSADPTMTFNGLPGDLNAAMNGLVYQGDTNYSGEDALSITTSDMGNTGAGGALVDVDGVPITVNNANDLPVLANPGTLAYTENQAPTSVSTTITLTDPDDTTMESADIVISDNYVNGQDVLAFVDTPTIVGAWTASAGYLTLTRVAGQTPTLDEWRDALRSVTYFNSSENPLAGDRSVGWRMNDGDGYSGFILSTITVAPANDAPTLTRNNALSLDEGASATITDESHLKVIDTDNSASQIVYTLATVPAHGQLQKAGTPLAVLGTVTQDDVDTDKIGYVHDGTEPSTDSFSFTISDGAGGSIGLTVFNISIVNVNDAPEVDAVIAAGVGDADAGETAYDFTVTLSDDSAIDVATLDNNDVYVTTPAAGSIAAAFVSVDAPSNGTPRTATYRIMPPGGSWDIADIGTYTVGIAGSQVGDADNAFVAASANIGTFAVAFETAAPTVTNVSSSTPDGYYDAGKGITVLVTFSEPVTAAGTPQIALETGTTDAVAIYNGGTGSTVLSFYFITAAGQETSDLEYLSAAALSLNGGTIRDLVGNNAVLTLPLPGSSGSLGVNKAIVIDTTPPAAPNAPDLLAASDTGSSSTDNVTGLTTPTFSITGVESGATVTLRSDAGGTIGSAIVADGASTCTITPAAPLAQGAHVITVTQSDRAGNSSGASPAMAPNLFVAVSPTVATQAVTDITSTSATGHGDITALGIPSPTAHGLVWNTTGSPTLSDNFTNKGSASSAGAFTSSLTGLNPNTTYYVRAYVTNDLLTVYGNEVSFSTLETFTLTYTAGANGAITGVSPQTVAHGSEGTAVTAVPDAHYHFVNWSDASTSNPRTDTNVTANISVTANFAIDAFTLTISRSGSGAGTVTTDGGGINCGSTCIGSFGYGSVVLLTATPSRNSSFTGWSGDYTGTDNPLQITMDGHKTVQATFTTLTYQISGHRDRRHNRPF